MIRVYFDSDVINKIRNGSLPELAELISRSRSKLLIPFSPSHIHDKIPSKKNDENRFWEEIDFLNQFTNNKCIAFNKNTNRVQPLIVDAKKYADGIGEDNHFLNQLSSPNGVLNFLVETSIELDEPETGNQLKKAFETPTPDGDETIGSQLDDLVNRILSIRNDASVYKANRDIIRDHFKLPKDASNWKENVIKKIEDYIKESGLFESFHDMVESSFPNKENITRFSYYSRAYGLLDNIGYKPDEIDTKRNKGFNNHLQDSWHSFYGAYCDFFVVMDKRLEAKSKVLYEEYKIGTKIIRPEDFVSIFPGLISDNQISATIKNVRETEPIDKIQEDGVSKYLFRLRTYLFDYFTHLEYQLTNEVDVLVFTKQYDNYSDFLFRDEFDCVISTIHQYFGDELSVDDVKEKFKSDDEDEHCHNYYFDGGIAQLIFDTNKFYLSLYSRNQEN